jgi:pimeloyl-ACP methyl ester carboxylesterase
MAEIASRVESTGAERVTLPGVRHHPHLECPENLARLIADFLGKSTANGKS